MLPLLLRAFLAIQITASIYPVLRRVRERAGIDQQTCICIGLRMMHALPGCPA